MFVETLADAVAKAGGLGIARMLEHQLGGPRSSVRVPVAVPVPIAVPIFVLAPVYVVIARSSVAGTAGGRGAQSSFPGFRKRNPEILDDPNSEAPLAEDPSAPSIDDYQRPGQPSLTRSFAPALAPGSGPGEITGEITSGFGPRIHPITHDLRFHTGVDLRAATGSPIHAAAGGVVIEAGRRGGYGNTVEIDHGHGTTTLYAHASAVLVEKGQRVEPGQTVALVGQTGQATGPHLHFELRRNDHPVNPSVNPSLSPSWGQGPIALGRALNSYRERAEIPGGGTASGAGKAGTR
jgi:murein DD-endopeptidase MepM/ murein hydrolase activator NlpD